jgi:hypothetical protein
MLCKVISGLSVVRGVMPENRRRSSNASKVYGCGALLSSVKPGGMWGNIHCGESNRQELLMVEKF